MSDALSILIVDDDESNREYLSALLEALGFAAEGAAGGREALERLSRQPRARRRDRSTSSCRSSTASRRCAATAPAAARRRSSCARRSTRPTPWSGRCAPAPPTTSPSRSTPRSCARSSSASPATPRARRAGDAAAARAPAHARSARARRCARVDELIDRIADADVPVLITGESGVGKDVVAREIHARSARAGARVRQDQLRRAARRAARVGAVRPRARLVHRRRRRPSPASSSSPTAARCSSTRSARCR